MDYFLSKLLPLFFYPLGLAIAVGLWVSLVGLRQGARKTACLGLVATAGLWLSSTPFCADWLFQGLQQPFPLQPMTAIPKAEAILVLGGLAEGPADRPDTVDYADSIERALYARHLFLADKAPLLLISGGSAPGWRPEAEIIADLLVDLGVPRTALLTESKSRNTRQNALFSQVMLQERQMKRVLLVTSAYHMQRAQATFRALGVEVIPAPTDHHLTADEFPSMNWLPKAEALEHSTRALKEYLGWVVYRLRGWA